MGIWNRLSGRKNYLLSVVQTLGAAAFTAGLITPEQYTTGAATVAVLQGAAVADKVARDRTLGPAPER